MKILLFSDSHGYIHNMVKAVSKVKNADMIIHLGDCVKDALKLKESYKGIRFEIVKGNNDWTMDFTNEKVLEIDGKRIFITHGHLYNVKNDYQRIILKGKAIGADAVFFGHTHISEETFSEGMLVLNPGSISVPRGNYRSTFCIIEIKDGKFFSRFDGF